MGTPCDTDKSLPANDWTITFGRVILAFLCIGAAILRALSEGNTNIDWQVLLFFLTSGVLLMLPYWTKFNLSKDGVELGFGTPADKKALKEFGAGGIKTGSEAVDLAGHAPGGAKNQITGELSDDPQKGLWGGKEVADGYSITAVIDDIENSPDWFRVTLKVQSQEKATTMRDTQNVRFHLHPTFKQTTTVQRVINGCASLNLVAWGAFTVGAEILDAEGNTVTRLELDLAQVAGAPETFRLR
jgi:hypothetical protein